MRWRLSLVCRLCGFDPVLYKKSPALASQKVRQFFEENVRKPEFFLSRSPLLEVHRRHQEVARKNAEYEFIMGKKMKAPVATEVSAPAPRSASKGLNVSRSV